MGSNKRKQQVAGAGETGNTLINAGEPVSNPKAAKVSYVGMGRKLAAAVITAAEKADGTLRDRVLATLSGASHENIEDLVKGIREYRKESKATLTKTQGVRLSRLTRVYNAANIDMAKTLAIVTEHGIENGLKLLPKGKRGRKVASTKALTKKQLKALKARMLADPQQAFGIVVNGIQAMRQADPDKAQYLVAMGDALHNALETAKAAFAQATAKAGGKVHTPSGDAGEPVAAAA